MGFIRKHLPEILATIFLAIAYFILRTLFLTRLPIFTDEAIYMRWAQIALHDANWRFISLTDGKQPLFIWVVMVVMKFIHDPLLAGRVVSVLTGFGTAIGLWFVSMELFRNHRIAFLTVLLYICFPFAQVVDRMALYDSMVALFVIWALYVSLLLVRHIRLDLSYTLGFVMGGGVLTKTNALFSALLLPVTLLLFNFRQREWRKKLLLWILLAGFAVVISQLLYSILRLSPFYHIISDKNAVFVYPVKEWIKHPFTYFPGNFRGLFIWLLEYLTPFYTFLILLATLVSKKFHKEKLLLLLYFVAPFLALALFGRIIFPRFIFFMALSLLPIAACGLNMVISWAEQFTFFKQRIAFVSLGTLLVSLAFVAYPLFVDYTFAADPVHAPIADADHGQYINNWTAGWGVKETVAYLQEQAKNHQIFVGTEGTFGLMPSALELYLVSNPHITIKGYWPISDSLPKEALEYAQKMPAYFVFYQPQHQQLSGNFPLQLIFEKQAGDSSYVYRLYQIKQ